MTALRISKTANQSGYGSDRYKSVTHLTKDERELVKNGVRVFFQSDRMSGGRYGTYWRVAVYKNGYINPRVPTDEEIALLEQM
ncbi:MAG: hypothetical protein KDD89_06475 [Anaerolineales bacterium]|nr:hypothetical protein [Anaerolineales bacterium]